MAKRWTAKQIKQFKDSNPGIPLPYSAPGFLGVFERQNKYGPYWVAMVKGKYIGRYFSPEEANEARLEWIKDNASSSNPT